MYMCIMKDIYCVISPILQGRTLCNTLLCLFVCIEIHLILYILHFNLVFFYNKQFYIDILNVVYIILILYNYTYT